MIPLPETPVVLRMALQKAADRADEWPVRHAGYAGMDEAYRFVETSDRAVRFHSPDLTLARALGWEKHYALSLLIALWAQLGRRHYLDELHDDPIAVATVLRSVDPGDLLAIARRRRRGSL